MEIQPYNYEVYFLDYLDGRLSPVQTAELIVFLEQNPGLKKELREISQLHIAEPDGNLEAWSKKILQKKANSDCPEMNPLDENLLDILEGESLIPKEVIDSQGNAFIRKEFSLLSQTRLSPDTGIVFPGKSRLKKKPWITRLYPYAQVAAVVVFILISGILLYTSADDGAKEPSAGILNRRVVHGIHWNKPVHFFHRHLPELPINTKTANHIKPILQDKSQVGIAYISPLSIPIKPVLSIQDTHLSPEAYRNEYSALLASSNEADVSPAMATMNETAIHKAGEILKLRMQDLYESAQKYLLVNLAEAGINKINHIVQEKVTVNRDSGGRLKHFSLGNIFEFSKK